MRETQHHHTILDLAAALKLSPATVSRALNNTSYVRKETRERVMQMAVKLGYRKNSMAAGLRSNRTNTIGLILPKISMYFHAEVVTVVQNLLHAHGYSLIIGQSNDDPLMEKELAETFFSARVDALILACTLTTSDYTPFDMFSTHKVPVLFYDRVPADHYRAQVIRGDDDQGGYLAGNHLINAGCTNLAMICGPLSSNLYRDRSAGFLRALREHGLHPAENLIHYQGLDKQDTLSVLRTMFAASDRPDGIFVTSDRSAITVLEYTKQENITVPEELKIIGYSNDPVTAVVSPSLTTIDQFPSVFAEQLVEQLMTMIAGERVIENLVPPIITPVELVIRSSC